MKASVKELSDPPTQEWEPAFAKTLDAMMLVADDDEDFLLRQGRLLVDRLEQFATVAWVQVGKALRNEQNEGIEHFGYVDGRSQHLYLTTDFGTDANGNTIGKRGGPINLWNPFEPLKRVLVPDKLGDNKNCFGSSMVFRKLEQDVLHFKMREQELADALGSVGDQRELAGALAVGRFEDGTPVALSQTDGFIPPKENNFTYAADANEGRCPFQAHIRKANPRGDIVRTFGAPEEAERVHRITRRGITYGARKKDPEKAQEIGDLPTKEVGLLFMCFQASIANQFAFMQRRWINNTDFVALKTGLDPVVAGATSNVDAKWPVKRDNPANVKPFSVANFVTLKGGEFFFAPSLAFFQNL